MLTIVLFLYKDPIDRKLWQELKETGVLHMQLINKVFEDLHGSGREALQQNVLEMMEKYGFLARFHHHFNSSEIKYFVPAQLRESHPELWKLTPQQSDPFLQWICSSRLVPAASFSSNYTFPEAWMH